MAQTQKEQRGIHPLAAYNFRVTVDGVAMRRFPTRQSGHANRISVL